MAVHPHDIERAESLEDIYLEEDSYVEQHEVVISDQKLSHSGNHVASDEKPSGRRRTRLIGLVVLLVLVVVSAVAVGLAIGLSGSDSATDNRDEVSSALDNFVELCSTGNVREGGQGEFIVNNEVGSQDCQWLSSNLSDYPWLCRFVDVAVACPVTCDICSHLSS